ncbi:MAG: hypothetical protein Q4D98_12775 [Planctomycetia bacterium]|nr:hypothetical protein [Planctomycetia bacterium]
MNAVIVQRCDYLQSYCRKRGCNAADTSFISWLYLFYLEHPQVLDTFIPEKGTIFVFLTGSKILRYRWMDFRDQELGCGCGNFVVFSLSNHKDKDTEQVWDIPAKETQADDADFMATLVEAFDQYITQHQDEVGFYEEQAVVQLYPYLAVQTGEGTQAAVATVLCKIGNLRPEVVSHTLLEACHENSEREYQTKAMKLQEKIQVGRSGSRAVGISNRKLISLSIMHLFCPLAAPKYQYELLRLNAVLAYQRVSRYRREFLPLLLPERLEMLAHLEKQLNRRESQS